MSEAAPNLRLDRAIGNPTLGVTDAQSKTNLQDFCDRRDPRSGGDSSGAVQRGRAGSPVRAAGLRHQLTDFARRTWGSDLAAPIFITSALAVLYLSAILWFATHDVRMYACSFDYLRQLNPIRIPAFLAVSLAVVGSLGCLVLNRELRYTVLLELRGESQEFLRQVREKQFSIIASPQELYAWGHGRNRKGNQ